MGEPTRGPRGPRPLSDVLGSLLAARGFGRLRLASELESAWEAAVGTPAFHQTRLGTLRRGVLSVTVAHPALLEELAAFRKPELLAALRRAAPDAQILDIRFRVGSVDDESDMSTEP